MKSDGARRVAAWTNARAVAFDAVVAIVAGVGAASALFGLWVLYASWP